MANVIAMKKRFGGYLPVVIDVETGGVNPQTDALLEVGAVFLTLTEDGKLAVGDSIHFHVEPFPKARITAEALRINKIQPDHPFRLAETEEQMLKALFKKTRQEIAKFHCSRAVLVGHNAHFDLSFLQAAIGRCEVKNAPYHRFTCMDTATLGSAAMCQSVLARALEAAEIPFDSKEAHSARYDAQVTAELFCRIMNDLDQYYGRSLQEVEG